MTHALAAVFEHRADAERAQQALVQAGFDRATMRLDARAAQPAVAEHHSVTDDIRSFFDELFRGHHVDRHLYGEAVERGHVVLTLQANTRDEAERASDLIEAFGPLDLDREAVNWGAGGWTASTAANAGVGTLQAGVGSMQSAPAASATASGSPQGQTAQGAQQRADATAPQDRPAAGPEPARRGARIYPRDGGSNQDSLDIQRGGEADSDEQYFRSHWQTTLFYAGTYQEFDPAYRYGASMAGSSAYRDLPWEQAEQELRTTWEHTYPQSAWERFKDAIRAGWRRVVH